MGLNVGMHRMDTSVFFKSMAAYQSKMDQSHWPLVQQSDCNVHIVAQ